jgi:gliding motility-associated-like protein
VYKRQAGNIQKFVWDFGDGTVKTELAPFAGTTLHTFNIAGIFNVSLTAFTDKGCSLKKVKTSLIYVQPPQIIKTNLPDSGCAPLTIRPKVQFNIDPVITSWKWTIKDKAGRLVSSSIVQDPGNIVFNDSGKYTIELEIISSTGCNQTYNWVVKVGKVPDDFSFSVTPPSNCASSPFSFKYLGPDVSGFKWKFSTGDSVDKRDFTKLFKKIEKVEVTLTAYLNGCAKTMPPMSFNVLGVVASFSVIGDCQTPLEKVIKDGSVGQIDTWEWKFGDGETRTYTSKKDTLNHRYAKSGPYMVALKVSGGGCTFIDSILVNAANENGIDFKPSKTPVCIADSFLVLNAIADNPQMIKSYTWDGGCGYTGQITTANPKIYFTDLCKYPTNLNRGLYRMQLRIEDLNGCIYTSPARDIMAAGPIANYSTLSATSGCENLPVSFQDRSNVDGINQVISRLWDFGDGTAVTNILTGPVQHIYRKPGSYTVKLTLVDNLGCNSVVEKTTVQVSQSGVDFYPLQTASCLNKLVQFQVITPTKYVSFKWDLGDGGPLDFTASPTVKYTVVGKKDISLTVVDGFGCQSTTKKAKLVEIDMPSADIDVVKDYSNCPPFPAQFLFKGKFAESYKWSFGNGASSAEPSPTYVYLKPGKYNATLKVVSPGGCEANSRVIPITVEGPTGIVDYNPVACEPFNALIKVDSRNAKSVTIDYGDGYADENLNFGTGQYLYQYKDSGTYTPNVFISNGLGCTVLLPQGDPIKAVSVLPIFRGDDLFHCDRGNVNFSDLSLSNDQLAGWTWQFGDLKTGTGKKPSHFYQSPGLYNVKMTVTTSLGCVDTLTRVQYVDIQASPDIAMDVSKPVVCEEDLIQLSGVEVRPNNSPIISWFWDFTNGNSADVQIPEKQLFRKAGTYPIRIYATNQKGCSDTLIQNLVVNAIPSLDAGSDSVLCFGTPIQLKPQGATTYEWLSGPSLSCTNCEQPFINPVADAIYFVKGTSAVGCSVIDSINIKVIQSSKVVAPADTLVCFGDAIRLEAKGTPLYSWTPANGLSRTDIAGPIVKPTQTTTYTVTGRDAYNCFVTKDDVVVRVVPLPTVNAGRDTTIMAGYPLQLKPVYSPDVSRVKWVPGLFLNCSDCKTPVTTPSYSATYTLFAYTPEGCMSKDVVNVFATCTGDNLFIPNTFSPNGDGVNEVFYPRGRGIEKIRSMKIFSRWGQLIYIKENFLANDQNAAWDGKRQGQFVTPDVYVYMVDLVCENGNIITLKGDVTLIR